MLNRIFKPLFRKRSWLWSVSLLAVISSFGSLPAPAVAAPESVTVSAMKFPSKLEDQVKEWVAKLAEQKTFQSWQSVDPQIEALGPGTHSWLVLFTKEGKDIGYMVVHAVTDGSFQLGEYGVGPYSLFSQQQLRQSLIESGLLPTDQAEHMSAVKHYIHPFAAAWEVAIGVETYWLDAKTAEQLPLDAVKWNRLFEDSISSKAYSLLEDSHENSRITQLLLNEPFDAYEKLPWLTEETPFPAKDASKLQKSLRNKEHLRYVTEPFGEAMLYAVPIIGYQRWSNDRMDLAIDMEGTRFIPLNDLLPNGLFYR